MTAEEKPVNLNADVAAFLRRTLPPAEDPAIKPWREAMEQSTSARLRAVEAELAEAQTAFEDTNADLIAARAEIQRLTALLDRMPGYHLTEKGLAALAEPTQEQP